MLSLVPAPLCADASTFRAGVAKVTITPREAMWMSGYGGRDRPAEGKLTDLWAKCLVIEDARGERLVWITLDLVGIDRDVAGRVCEALASRHGLKRSQIALCTSHTHTGPVVGRNLRAMYFLSDAQWQQVDAYTEELEQKIVALVGEALDTLAPCTLAWGVGEAKFAVNRRNNPEPEVPRLRAEGALEGPVDHDVPVLAVYDADRQLRAVLFGYACHATVLSFYQWSGDYPGFAQIALEEAHPGTTALFWAGCGADQNPLPRREVEHAREYGRQLAAAVDEVLADEMTPVAGELMHQYAEIDLPFDDLPTAEQLQADAESSNRFVASRAKLLLERLERDGALQATYPYPVQVWHLGRDLLFIALGGEVVVDYALRLKHELGPRTTWVAGYANDVMAYIPSRRVLTEGGYEGGGAMVYYGLPTVWAPEVEEQIVREVCRLAEQ